MSRFPDAQDTMKQRLSDLRMQQYAILINYPVDWCAVGKLGQKILALEIRRKHSSSSRGSRTTGCLSP